MLSFRTVAVQNIARYSVDAMDRREVINYLRQDNSSAIFRHLLLNPRQQLIVTLLIDNVMAKMTVKKMTEFDAFIVWLDIPGEYWSVNYIDFEELFPDERLPNGPPG